MSEQSRGRRREKPGEPCALVGSASEQAAYRRARRRVHALRRFYRHLGIYVVVGLGLTGINLLTAPDRIWFWRPVGFWGLGVLVHGLSVWSGSVWLGREWEERKIAEQLSREKIRVLSSEKQLAEAQLRMLQAQIEPHFLFNTLANVVSLIDSAPDRATAMLEHFIAYLRASLAASRATRGTVAQEASLLGNYLELLKIRMGERLDYTIDVDPSLVAEPLAPMLLQPVVENAVRHGLEPKIAGGRVDVTIRRDGDRMIARVEDDGLGFRPGASAGMGLQNLRERLAVLYDGEARLVIEELPVGTAILLDLPASSATR